MSEKQKFTPQERAPYMAYFQDGLWDILLGSLLLVMGLSFLSDEFYVLALLLILVAPFMWEAKQRITVPRLPPMRYSTAQFAKEERRKGVILVAAGFVLMLGILLFTAVNNNPLFASQVWQLDGVPLGILLACGVGLVGYVYRELTWAVYAFLLMALTLASWGFGLSFPGCVLLAGLLIFISGLSLFSRFLHQHPPIAFS